jgi:hypothetical protein
MSENKLSIFDSEDLEDAVEAQPVETEAAIDAPETEPQQAEADQGDAGVKEGEPPAPADETGSRVPVMALLDEREKRQKLEAEKSQLAQEMEAMKQDLLRMRQQLAPRPQQQKPVDWYENPDARWQAEQRAIADQMMSSKLDVMEVLAREKYGDEVVDTAFREFERESQQRPELKVMLQRSRQPWAELVKWHQRHQLDREIGEDPAAYRERMKEEIRQQLLAEMQQPATAQSSRQTPPGSLASAPSMRGQTPTAINEPAALRGFFSS